ncbi:MAG: hypothetical protein PUF49_10650 [Firmicutes bacterium]|nr:hypothetical protein [Bacillota bacterium]
MQNNEIQEFARSSSCRLRNAPNRIHPKARGSGSAYGRQFLAELKNLRICKKSFLAQAENRKFARRNLEIRGEASCKTMESRNLQEALLAGCEMSGIECTQKPGAAVWLAGRQFLAKPKNMRICKKSFLAKAENQKYARRNLEIRGEASCKTMKFRNLQEALLAGCEMSRIECAQSQ